MQGTPRCRQRDQQLRYLCACKACVSTAARVWWRPPHLMKTCSSSHSSCLDASGGRSSAFRFRKGLNDNQRPASRMGTPHAFAMRCPREAVQMFHSLPPLPPWLWVNSSTWAPTAQFSQHTASAPLQHAPPAMAASTPALPPHGRRGARLCELAQPQSSPNGSSMCPPPAGSAW